MDFIKHERRARWPACTRPLWLTLIAATLAGCGESKSDSGVSVSGTVNLDGKPLPTGLVLFHAASSTASMGSKASAGSVSAMIQNGQFSLPADQGPPAGAARVEVIANNQLDFEIDDQAAFAAAVRQGKPVSPVNTNVAFRDPQAKNVVISENAAPFQFDLISVKPPASGRD